VLDLLITVDGSRLVSRVNIVAVGVSDHNLVFADVDVDRPLPSVREFTYRKIKNLNKSKFRSKLLASPAYTSPVDNVDGFADQLDRSLTDVLDELTPLLMQTKRCGRRSNRWLSPSAQSELGDAWNDDGDERGLRKTEPFIGVRLTWPMLR